MIRCAICGASAGDLTEGLAIEAGWVPGRPETKEKRGKVWGQNMICPQCVGPPRHLPEAAK